MKFAGTLSADARKGRPLRARKRLQKLLNIHIRGVYVIKQITFENINRESFRKSSLADRSGQTIGLKGNKDISSSLKTMFCISPRENVVPRLMEFSRFSFLDQSELFI